MSSLSLLRTPFVARPLLRHARLAHNVVTRKPAEPHTPPSVSPTQAPNRATTWSKAQAARTEAMQGPRFEQTDERFQPRPLAAIELIAEEPIRLVQTRVASCDGGGGSLGHPKIFINLDKPGPKACNYCGIRFEKEEHTHGHH